MGERVITSCRGCKSKRLKSALRINGKDFVVCQLCTLLQRLEDTPYSITFDFSSGGISVAYYPYFLRTKFPKDDSIVYFSLKSIEVILEQAAYKVIDAQTTDEGRLEVKFEKMDNLDKLRLYEMMKKLDSQYTYFLHAVKKK